MTTKTKSEEGVVVTTELPASAVGQKEAMTTTTAVQVEASAVATVAAAKAVRRERRSSVAKSTSTISTTMLTEASNPTTRTSTGCPTGCAKFATTASSRLTCSAGGTTAACVGKYSATPAPPSSSTERWSGWQGVCGRAKCATISWKRQPPKAPRLHPRASTTNPQAAPALGRESDRLPRVNGIRIRTNQPRTRAKVAAGSNPLTAKQAGEWMAAAAVAGRGQRQRLTWVPVTAFTGTARC
mmetsp:Transcript_2798/g.5006  ORF Transcript_2798/g.5006 Transcript_2798/m.5006 type:complete len:241 (-) Transcript_2798:17-739(-)